MPWDAGLRHGKAGRERTWAGCRSADQVRRWPALILISMKDARAAWRDRLMGAGAQDAPPARRRSPGMPEPEVAAEPRPVAPSVRGSCAEG
jgi:hypothetical protein